MADYDKANLRRQMPPTDLSDEVKDDLVNKVLKQFGALQDDRGEWAARQTEFLEQWDDSVSPNRKGPFESNSNFHLPITMEQLMAVTSRMIDIIFGIYPWFYIKSNKPADDKTKQQSETLQQWALERLANRNQGVFSAVYAWLWDWGSTGRGVMKWVWDEEREKYVDVKPIVDEQGNVVGEENKEVEELIYCGPKVTAVLPENFFIGAGYSVEDAPIIVERTYLTPNDLHCLKKYKYMWPSAIDAVLELQPDTQRNADRDSNLAKARDAMEGAKTVDSLATAPAYSVLECYVRFDVNDDGYEERIICWVEEKSKTLLGWNYLYRASKAGRPPYAIVDYLPGRSGPKGLVELLYPINTMMDGIYNLRMDSGILMNLPWGTVKEGRSLKAADIRIKPGEFVPVSEHDDIMLQTRPTTQPFMVQEESLLMRHVDKLSISELGQGLVPNQVGPLGTATGTAAMLSEMNKRISVLMQQVRTAWAQVLKGVYQLLYENLPLGTVYRVTGQDGKDLFGVFQDRKSFMSEVDFHFVSPQATLNKEADRQNSIVWLQTISNPLYLQLGLTNPQTIKNALVDVAKSFNKQGIQNYVAEPQMQSPPQPLEEEIAFILQGLMPYITINDNHQAKIQGLIEHRDSEELAKFFHDPALLQIMQARFNQAIKKHAEMLQAIQAQAAASNVSGIQVAPTMNNRLAGLPTTAESPEGQPAPLNGGAGGSNAGVTGGSDTEGPQ